MTTMPSLELPASIRFAPLELSFSDWDEKLDDDDVDCDELEADSTLLDETEPPVKHDGSSERAMLKDGVD